MFHPRYSRRQALAGGVAAIAAGSVGRPHRAHAADEINALVWCDHSDPNLLSPFEEANGIKVNTKEFGATGEALAVLEQSKPGDWDVLVLDTVDIPRVAEKGYLADLDDADYPMADIFPEVQSPEFNKPGGKTYGVTEKFGYNCFSYNNTKVDPADMRKSEVMWNGKYTGRLAIYDYYNPIIAMVAIGIGIKPSELKQEHIPAIKEKLLAMKKQSALVGDVVDRAERAGQRLGRRDRRRRRICGGRPDGREAGTGLGAAGRWRRALDAVDRHLQGLRRARSWPRSSCSTCSARRARRGSPPRPATGRCRRTRRRR